MNRRLATRSSVGALLGFGLALGILGGRSIAVGDAASLAIGSSALTPYATCVLTAASTTTTVVSDAEVRQSKGTTNYGTATSLTVTSSGSANRRIYVSFDLTACSPAIPPGATIRLATLRLFATTLPAICRTLDLFRVTAAWTESAVTWNNQPFGTTINNPATGSRSGSFDVGTPAGCQNRTSNAYVVGADVTADVAAFVAGGPTNRGWMIRDDAEGSATARTAAFAAKQLGTLARAPQLVVTYVVAP